VAEFNPFGTLVAVGCKYGNVLVVDYLTKTVIRCLSLYEEYSEDVNNDVEEFAYCGILGLLSYDPFKVVNLGRKNQNEANQS
jgi:hypothetical protein